MECQTNVDPRFLEPGDTIPEGLTHVPGYLSAARQQEVLNAIERLAEHKRQRGDSWAVYPYDTLCEHTSASSAYTDSQLQAFLEEFFASLNQGIIEDGYATEMPDNTAINRYHIFNGIHRHRDTPLHARIGVLSLCESSVLRMAIKDTRHQANLLVCPGDLYVLTGPARFQWSHATDWGETFTHRDEIYRKMLHRIALVLRSEDIYLFEDDVVPTQTEFSVVTE